MVRHWVLAPVFEGSSPSSSALLTCRQAVRHRVLVPTSKVQILAGQQRESYGEVCDRNYLLCHFLFYSDLMYSQERREC